MAPIETMVKGYRLTREGRRIAIYNKLEDLVNLAENWTEAEEWVNEHAIGNYDPNGGPVFFSKSPKK